MKKQVLALAVSGLFTLAFFGILALGGEQMEKREALNGALQENLQVKAESDRPGGAEAGAPGYDDYRQISDAQKFPFSAQFFQNDGRLILGLESQGRNDVEFSVYDMSGKKVFSHIETAADGENHFRFSLRYAAPGIYFIRASMQGMSRTVKVSKLGMES